MKGHVPTPAALVDQMVQRLFAGAPPNENDRLLDPGCGDGAFIDGVLRWCLAHRIRPPRIVGVELNPSLVAKARRRFAGMRSVEIVNADYLGSVAAPQYRYVVGNPPYVSLVQINERQRQRFRERYAAAHGRFDLYLLFMEKAISDTAEGGRMAFVTPEKYLYVEAAAPLRRLMAAYNIESIELIAESIFTDHTVYPAVTILQKQANTATTHVRLRNNLFRDVRLPLAGDAWWPALMGHVTNTTGTLPLSEHCLRVSAGIATGADKIFVRSLDKLQAPLWRYAHPALSGRDLDINQNRLPTPNLALLAPYDAQGALLPEQRLGALGEYLRQPDNQAQLIGRSCVERKPWYAFHDNYPVLDIRRPKILCKDIGLRPRFWVDRTGEIIPLHSVYYIVPLRVADLIPLCVWLNGQEAGAWLANHCQRASNGFVRLQSHVLQKLPVPAAVTVTGHYTERVA